MNLWKCQCCGSLDVAPLSGLDVPADPGDHVCGMCRRRGRLCVHNMGEHPGRFHYSRVHEDDRGAEDPSTCQWCLAALLDRRR
jgi:hypothetical protein